MGQGCGVVSSLYASLRAYWGDIWSPSHSEDCISFGSVCSAFYGGLFPEPWRVAYNAGLHKGCFYKVGQFQLCKDRLFWLTACDNVFLFKEFSTDDSNASFEQCREVLLVCRFSDHKCSNYNQLYFDHNIIISNYVILITINICIVFVSSCRDTHHNTVRGYNISVSPLRYSANHNALDSWPIRTHLTSQKDELCKNLRVSERRGIEEKQ